jgi:hypothetical protein
MAILSTIRSDLDPKYLGVEDLPRRNFNMAVRKSTRETSDNLKLVGLDQRPHTLIGTKQLFLAELYEGSPGRTVLLALLGAAAL